jgi:DNA polymerase elongation subunit (family B)
MEFYTSVNIRGNSILYRGYKNGKRETRRETFAPSFYLQDETGKYNSMGGAKLKELQFGDIRDAREFLEEYRNTQNLKIYGNSDFVSQYFSDNFKNEIKYDFKQLKVMYLDIETECEFGFPNIAEANEKILLITVKVNDEVHSFTTNDFVADGVFVHKCDTEDELLLCFLDVIKKIDPDIITGWNIRFFDLPYIANRITRVISDDVAQKLSPWNHIKRRDFTKNGKIQYCIEMPGYMVLDYQELYKKFSGTPQESYALNFICEAELGETKLDYSDYGSLREFYKQNYQKFAEYNVQDVKLVEKLEAKLKLIELAVSIAYEAKINFDGVFFSTRIWESICYNYLKSKGIVPPLKEVNEKEEQYVGAYVKEVVPGFYRNIVSFDATSLYPSIIMQFNISPDSVIGHAQNWGIESFLNGNRELDEFLSQPSMKNRCLAANGSVFVTDKKGFIPTLIEITFNQRQEAKKEMIRLEKEKENKGDPDGILSQKIAALKIKQSVKKILANSLYGCLGNPGFVYSSPELATAVTMTGQLAIRTAENSINEYFAKVTGNNIDVVIASDTDSLYIDLSGIVDKVGVQNTELIDFLDTCSKKAIQPVLEKAMEALGSKLNCVERRLSFKREAIASTGIFIAKKRNALCLHDQEGVRFAEPKIKVTGLEIVRSSTPKIVRDKLKVAVKLILMGNNEELIDFVQGFKTAFMSESIEKIAFPRGVSGVSIYADPDTIYKKSTPIATKAALLHNHQIKKLKLDGKYAELKEGDKIKYVYLKVPNPFGKGGRDSSIGFLNKPPKEFDLEKYADYETQFEKTFMEPLLNITNSIGWKATKKITLESLFG